MLITKVLAFLVIMIIGHGLFRLPLTKTFELINHLNIQFCSHTKSHGQGSSCVKSKVFLAIAILSH
jgi:hypothetical protein